MCRRKKFSTRFWRAKMPSLNLPDRVFLRTSPRLPCGEVYEAIGASRGRVYQWRTRGHGFPLTVDGTIDAAAVAGWLARHGCRVDWL